MEAKLVKNDHRPGWKDADPQCLLRHLVEHLDKLGKSMLLANREQIIFDAAYVANFAMMIADISKMDATGIEPEFSHL